MFRPAGRIPLHGEAIEGHHQLALAAAVEQIQGAARRQKLLGALACQGAPGGAQHQHHHAGMHEHRPDPAQQALAGRQPAWVALDLPALGLQHPFQLHQAGGRRLAGHGFGHAQLAELAR